MNEVTQPVSGGGRLVSAMAMVAALVAFLMFAPLASAASDPLAGGSTKITLNNGFVKKLKKNKVKVLKVSPATVKGKVVTLPVSGGSLDPATGAGSIEHSGGIKFKRGKKTAPIKGLVLDSSTGALNAKVAGKQMKFASVVGLSVARNGFGVNAGITKLKLTKNAAKRLNKKLAPSKKKGKKSSATASAKAKAVFKANQVLGKAASETQPKTVAVLPGGKADLTTDETTVKKFVSPPPAGFKVDITPIAPSEVDASFPPVLSFPIGGGTIAPDASSGIVQTTGGVKLHQNLGGGKETTMLLNAIWVDLGAKTATVEVVVESTIDPKLNLGNLGRSSIADVNLAGATITSDPATRTISIKNAVATLQPVTAETLNSVFGAPWDALEIPHPTFAAGDGLGTFSFSVQTQ